MPAGQTGSATSETANDLLGRIVSILDGARGQVVRAVNQSMITAYCIGKDATPLISSTSAAHCDGDAAKTVMACVKK